MTRPICILDTSVLCEVLAVPSKCSDAKRFGLEFVARAKGETLALPMTVIIETGNHIGQIGDGNERRRVAEKFCKFIATPEVPGGVHLIRHIEPAPFRALIQDGLRDWGDQRFPDWAQAGGARVGERSKGSGLGDFTIVDEFFRLRSSFRTARVYVWSLDEQLAGFDTERLGHA